MSSVAGSVHGTPASTQPQAPTVIVGEIDKNIKYRTVDPFTGERNKLQGFLLQLRLYVKFNEARFASETERVLWAVTLLNGKAMNWIEGFLDDYLNCTNGTGSINDSMEETTKKIFGSWDGFLEEIKINFGVMDEKREAQRAIESLKQKGSATAYTRDFQRYSTRTEWGDEALRFWYRRGLKDFIKDELLRHGSTTDTLEELVTAVCEIDNAWYERSMEKKGKYDPHYRRSGEGKQRSWKGNNRRDYGDPMELDATAREPMPDHIRSKHMADKTCFNCGKPGHMARNCRSKGRNPGKGRQKSHQLNATMTSMGRGKGYNGPMYLNATRWEEALANTEEEYYDLPHNTGPSPEVLAQHGITQEEYDTAEDISRHTLWETKILSGTNSAEYIQKMALEISEIAREAIKQQHESNPDSEKNAIQMLDKLADNYLEYWVDLRHLSRCIEKQIIEATNGTRKGQQYCDKLDENMEFQPRLKELIKEADGLKKRYRQTSNDMKERYDATKTDHPRHGELGWSFCPHDLCTIHYQAKAESGYWPTKKTPVYWPRLSQGFTLSLDELQPKN